MQQGEFIGQWATGPALKRPPCMQSGQVPAQPHLDNIASSCRQQARGCAVEGKGMHPCGGAAAGAGSASLAPVATAAAAAVGAASVQREHWGYEWLVSHQVVNMYMAVRCKKAAGGACSGQGGEEGKVWLFCGRQLCCMTTCVCILRYARGCQPIHACMEQLCWPVPQAGLHTRKAAAICF
jgi:hypothetical protein